MNLIPFQTIDWSSIENVTIKGETGFAVAKTVQMNGLRIRLVEYSTNYLADHWCQKGHIVHCLKGAFITELSTGEIIKLTQNESFVVSDDLSSHLTYSHLGSTLLIIDGDFLKQ
jgi:hypothetical protein